MNEDNLTKGELLSHSPTRRTNRRSRTGSPETRKRKRRSSRPTSAERRKIGASKNDSAFTRTPTQSSKLRSTTSGSLISEGEENDEDNDVRTENGSPGREDGHNPAWRTPREPDEKIKITCECCLECGGDYGESVGIRRPLVKELPDPHHQNLSPHGNTIQNELLLN
jgi:transposase